MEELPEAVSRRQGKSKRRAKRIEVRSALRSFTPLALMNEETGEERRLLSVLFLKV